MSEDLKSTPLAKLHAELGARMVPFAGWSMPVQYPPGILAEHLHTRASAGLFDVSHMGQATLSGPGAVAALERLVTADIAGLVAGRQRYALMTNDSGGIRDDLMAARIGEEEIFLVVNAACTDADLAHVAAHLPAGARLDRHTDRGLLALQGPAAAAVLARLIPDIGTMPFMAVRDVVVPGIGTCRMSRSGYTGEDGFELSVPAGHAEAFARQLLADERVRPAGLGARDSLRLEAGLPLYGSDLDAGTTPLEAGLGFAIGKRRRIAWDFPGGNVLREQLATGPARLRVGIRPEGRTIARAGTEIVAADGSPLGRVTSGGFAPSLDAPVSMGFVAAQAASVGTKVTLLVRGRPVPAQIVSLPFVRHRYVR